MSTEITPTMARANLIAALRDPNLWPEGFEWYFGECRSCGIGLLVRMMDGRTGTTSDWRNVEEKLGITPDEALHIFGRDYNERDSEVTPFMVADRLESLHNAMGEK